jgi:toxin ParE1/3/4
MTKTWHVWLAEGAERDFFSVLRWTTEQFGKRQARVYETTLRRALKTLASGPSVLGCRTRPDLGAVIASLHVARQGRKGRHLLVFRAHEQDGVIEVLRILHDSMDPARHLGA